jgi:hypothetical protein
MSPRLAKMSRVLNLLLVTIGTLVIAIALLRWFVIDNPNLLPPTIASYIKAGTLTTKHRLVGFIIELIPLSAVLFTLVSLYRICAVYLKGEVFSPVMGMYYRRFGKGLVLLSVANGLYTALLSAMFSLFSEKKELVISLGLSTADVYLLMIGVLFVMLGTVMDEAYRIHDENKQII